MRKLLFGTSRSRIKAVLKKEKLKLLFELGFLNHNNEIDTITDMFDVDLLEEIIKEAKKWASSVSVEVKQK